MEQKVNDECTAFLTKKTNSAKGRTLYSDIVLRNNPIILETK